MKPSDARPSRPLLSREAAYVCTIVLISGLAFGGCGTFEASQAAHATPAATAAASTTAPMKLGTGDKRRTVKVGRDERSYILHTPPQAGPAALPLVVMLHGTGGSAYQASKNYGWSEKADVEGFFVAYPDGAGRDPSWNVGFCCSDAEHRNIDDMGFIDAMIADIRKSKSINGGRIYATGFSNGAMLSHRLGAERADVFAAIAPVAGTVGGQLNHNTDVEQPGMPTQPVSVIMIHGKLDPIVPYAGGRPGTVYGGFRVDLSTTDSVTFWVTADDCNLTPETTTMANGKVIRDQYSNAQTGADVILYTIVNQGHAWPGAPKGGPNTASTDLSATDEIWAFFEAHAKG